MNRNCVDSGTFGDRTLDFSGTKVPSRFYLGDLVTHTEDREIRSVSWILPDYFGELACMHVWVEFVFGSLLCSERFSLDTLVFGSPEKQHFQIPIQCRFQWTNSHSVEVPL